MKYEVRSFVSKGQKKHELQLGNLQKPDYLQFPLYRLIASHAK